jgi:tetratricopeptide (TPR) repeat protein
LAKIADLEVISRTSTQHFKSSPDNLPQIAKQLGVANILEGSVQKVADQVRVNVQLINAASDAHLWAESFDRKLTDISAVESDIAKTVAETLHAKDDAIAQLRKTIEMDPHFYYAHWNLGGALELKGQLPEALGEYKRTAELKDDPFGLGLLAHASAKLAQRDKALKGLDQLQQIATRRYVSNYTFALVHIALGEKVKAINCLERAYRDRVGPDISLIKVDPMLDPLRGDPRFEALVQKVVGPEHN